MQIEEISSVINATKIEATNLEKDNITFESFFNDKFNQLNNQINESEELARKLAVGDVENIHQVMIALEKTKFQFTLITQVRNKLLEGYQEIMRMQI